MILLHQFCHCDLKYDSQSWSQLLPNFRAYHGEPLMAATRKPSKNTVPAAFRGETWFHGSKKQWQSSIFSKYLFAEHTSLTCVQLTICTTSPAHYQDSQTAHQFRPVCGAPQQCVRVCYPLTAISIFCFLSWTPPIHPVIIMRTTLSCLLISPSVNSQNLKLHLISLYPVEILPILLLDPFVDCCFFFSQQSKMNALA